MDPVVEVSVPATVEVSLTGSQGVRGNTTLADDGPPGPTTGIDGDWYYDVASYPTTVTLYGPKAAGAWPGTGVVIGSGSTTGALLAANNLNDVASKPDSRDNLGLGGAAILDVGNTTSTVASGDDPRFGEIAGIPIAGTPAAGKAPVLTDPSHLAWTAVGGGGGSGTSRTAAARITDDNLSGLPVAPAWVIVSTSGGTPLECPIAAIPGDRILVFGAFMYAGSHYLDWVLLATDGSIALYDTSGTASPSGEGNPTMYPSTSFSKYTSLTMFTVGSGHLNAGMATVALAHQGSASGTVYAYPLYPWRVFLMNIGPEPT